VSVDGSFDFEGNPTPLANITIMGVQNVSGKATFNGSPLESVDYDQDGMKIQVTDLEELTKNGAWNQSWELDWS